MSNRVYSTARRSRVADSEDLAPEGCCIHVTAGADEPRTRDEPAPGERCDVVRLGRRDGTSQAELSKSSVVQAEVMPDLMAHRLGDVSAQLLGVVAKVAHERVTENQDLVRHATAAEEAPPARLEADVLAVGVVLGAAV